MKLLKNSKNTEIKYYYPNIHIFLYNLTLLKISKIDLRIIC